MHRTHPRRKAFGLRSKQPRWIVWKTEIRTTKITNMNLLHWAGHDSIPCQNPLRHK